MGFSGIFCGTDWPISRWSFPSRHLGTWHHPVVILSMTTMTTSIVSQPAADAWGSPDSMRVYLGFSCDFTVLDGTASSVSGVQTDAVSLDIAGAQKDIHQWIGKVCLEPFKVTILNSEQLYDNIICYILYHLKFYTYSFCFLFFL